MPRIRACRLVGTTPEIWVHQNVSTLRYALAVDQYLYRLFGPDGTLLYTGVSDDWTRRLRQHWQTKQWAPEILGVTLETYSDRVAVLAAERKAIRAENPLYNIQHNHHSRLREGPARSLTAADMVLIGAMVVAAGFIIYALSQVAIEKYQAWKTDREEFRKWQRTRNDRDDQPTQACDKPGLNVVSLTAVIPPPAVPPDSPRGVAFIGIMAFYADKLLPVSTSIGSVPPPQNGTSPA